MGGRSDQYDRIRPGPVPHLRAPRNPTATSASFCRYSWGSDARSRYARLPRCGLDVDSGSTGVQPGWAIRWRLQLMWAQGGSRELLDGRHGCDRRADRTGQPQRWGGQQEAAPPIRAQPPRELAQPPQLAERNAELEQAGGTFE